jgi:hypothetical protein
MKFKSNIEVQAGIEDKDGQVGSNGQILASTGSQVDWIDPANIVTSATDVIIECKNTSGVTIAKGTPVYQTGNVGATAVIEVAVADASDEDKMAAIGLLQSDLINNAFGYVVVTGELLNITTSPIDGVTPTIGDTIYVKPGGGLTLTKPTGVNFIQNVGLVGKVSGGNAGSITVSSIMRSNDVPTPLYIDHDNQRLGIGTASPAHTLSINGTVSSNFFRGYTYPDNSFLDFDKDDTAASNYTALASIGRIAYLADTNANEPVANAAHEFFTGTSDIDTATSLMVINTNGNVGIGTTSPGQKLDVDGSVNIDGTLFVNTNNNHIRLIDTDNTGNFSVGVNSNFQIRDITANTTPLTIRAGTPGNTILTTASGRVGIGLSSPGTTLHVGGFTRIDGGLQLNATNATIYQILDSALRFGTNNTERMRIDADGNVGIGTTSPDTRLEVVEASPTNGIVADFVNSTNAAGTTAAIKLSNADSEACDVVLGANRVGANFGSDFFISLSDSVDGSNQERFRITEAGNVGIGTTSPSEKLDVSGSANFSTDIIVGRNATALSFDMNPAYDSGNYYLKLHKNQSNDGGVLLYSKPTSGSAQLDWQIVNQGTTGDLKFYAAGLAGNALVLDRETGSLQLPEYGAGTLVSDASGNITVSSGGGAGGPYLPLAGGTMTGNIKGGNAVKLLLGAGDVFQLYNDGNGFLRNYTGNLYIDQNTDNGLITFRNDDGTGGIGNYLVLDGNTTHAYFSNPGNVGIGTTSPSTKLNISSASFNDHITLTRSTDELGISVSGGQLMFEGGVSPFNNNNEDLGRSDKYWKELFVYSVRSGGGLQFKTSGNNERMRISSTGNVGIGTTSPVDRLDLYDANDNVGIYFHTATSGTGGGNGLRVGQNNANAFVWNYEATPLSLATGGTARLTINATGGIRFNTGYGAGTLVTDASGNITVSSGGGAGGPYLPLSAGPSYPLTNSLYISSSGANGLILKQDTSAGSNSGRIFFQTDTAAEGVCIMNSNGRLDFRTGSDPTSTSGNIKMVLTNAGNVGIGTTSPEVKLHVGTATLGVAPDTNADVISSGGITIGNNKRLSFDTAFYVHGNIKYNNSGTAATEAKLEYQGYYGHNFITRSSSKMVIQGNTGNVGIGTSSPSSKLQVAGGIQMADDTATASADKVGTMRYRTGTEYVEVDGIELVTNGDFATDSDWGMNTGVTISGGTMNFTSTAGHYGSQNINFTNGAKYKINFEITAETSGTLTVFLGAGNNVGSISGIGKKEIIATGNSSLDTKVYFGNLFTGSIDNVSIVEVTEEDASYADMCMQTGASTYEWVNIVRNTY